MLLLCCFRSRGASAVSCNHFDHPLPCLELMDISLVEDAARSAIVRYPGCLYPLERRQYRTGNGFLWIKESAVPPGTQLTQH